MDYVSTTRNVSFARFAPKLELKRDGRKLDPAHLERMRFCAPIICDFTRKILSDPRFHDRQMLFVGRSMDMPFHAAMLLTFMDPSFVHLRPNIFLIDYSRYKFDTIRLHGDKYLRNYFESCGIDPNKGIVVIDDETYSGRTLFHLFKAFSSGRPKAPKIKIAVLTTTPDYYKGPKPHYVHVVERPDQRSEITVTASYLNSQGITPLAYDPQRSYDAMLEGDKFVPVYDKVDFTLWRQARIEFMRFCVQYWKEQNLPAC